MNQQSNTPVTSPEWLLLGIEGCGKSCLVRALKESCQASSGSIASDIDLATGSTNGVERDELTYEGKHTFIVKEIGGSMKTTWSSYFQHCSGVIFVIDRSQPTTLSHALMELVQLLQHPKLQNTDFIIVLNKSDAPGSLTRQELQASIRLDDLLVDASHLPHRTSLVETSAAKEVGIGELLELIKKRPSNS